MQPGLFVWAQAWKNLFGSPTNWTTTEDSDFLVFQILPVTHRSLLPPQRVPPKCIINCWEVWPCVGLGKMITAVWVPVCKVCIMPRRWCSLAILSVFWLLRFPQPPSSPVLHASREVVSTSLLGLNPQPVECPLTILHWYFKVHVWNFFLWEQLNETWTEWRILASKVSPSLSFATSVRTGALFPPEHVQVAR